MFLTPRFFVISAGVAFLSAIGFFWAPAYTVALVLLAALAIALPADAALALLLCSMRSSRCSPSSVKAGEKWIRA